MYSSDMLIYTFQVHYNAQMSPLELEMHHLLENVIGVRPSFYEYLFTIDADTTVEPSSLNALVSA
jgi:chitin synthase